MRQRPPSPPVLLVYLPEHQVADGNDGGVAQLQNLHHFTGLDVQGQLGQLRCSLSPALQQALVD